MSKDSTNKPDRTIIAPYSLEGIKYFGADAPIVNACPKCGADASFNTGGIEYPEQEETHEWECECGALIVVKFNLELTCKISNISIEAFED
jgi:hypothetical protein